MSKTQTHFKSWRKRAVPLFTAAIAMFCVAQTIWEGREVLGRFETDKGSEFQAVEDAFSIARGEHHAGIVSYSHYPNGPSYLLLPFIALGAKKGESLRELPFWSAVLAIAWLMFLVARYPTRRGSAAIKVWALVGLTLVFHQQGIRYWMGALHHHSYAMSLALLSIGTALTLRKGHPAFALLGFVSGWIGYDPLPIQVLSFAALRWMHHSRNEKSSARDWLRDTVIDGALMSGGMAAAVILHLIQNSIYFGSWSLAFRDLIGSAGARMGADSAASLSPDYAQGIHELTSKAQESRFQIFTGLLVAFVRGGWMRVAPLWVISITGIGLLAYSKPWYKCRQAPLRIAGFALLLIAAMAAWSYIMPNHARFHPHFVPRHYFVALIALLVSPLLWSDSSATQRAKK